MIELAHRAGATVLIDGNIDLGFAGDVYVAGLTLEQAERKITQQLQRFAPADGGRDKWRSAIGIVETLNPRWIVAGHKNKDLDDTAARAISETREYLNIADELLSQHSTALGFFNAMVERFPDRLNPGALWLGAAALYR